MRYRIAALSIIVVLLLSACTQWGTSALRNPEVWWACTDRYTSCSNENALLTLIQMDNVLLGARKDFYRAGGVTEWKGPGAEPSNLNSLRIALLAAYSARSKITLPPSWSDPLADYVQASIHVEKLARKTY